MNVTLTQALVVVGVAQLCVLVASALVPVQLDWRTHFQALPRLHRQMYWVYGGYVVLSIIALGTITIVNAAEIAAGSMLARSFSAYAAAFWGIRLALQGALDVREHLTSLTLRIGYAALTVLFTAFTVVFAWAALHPVAS
jgi:hypothetical protein